MYESDWVKVQYPYSVKKQEENSVRVKKKQTEIKKQITILEEQKTIVVKFEKWH